QQPPRGGGIRRRPRHGLAWRVATRGETAMHVGTGTFFQNLGKTRSDAEVYAHELSMADLGEPLGFDSVWAAEHHFTDYTMCPDPAQLLTYLAGRTQRVQLGTMVMVLPWHDPVRIAEHFTVLDHMSRGRAILGI